ncbi:hypothetical protein G9A89_008935 [Geosiphon pyriformis]|nr:hypothetical protein G9A89_008935 [Geosiphon pyriformis]
MIKLISISLLLSILFLNQIALANVNNKAPFTFQDRKSKTSEGMDSLVFTIVDQVRTNDHIPSLDELFTFPFADFSNGVAEFRKMPDPELQNFKTPIPKALLRTPFLTQSSEKTASISGRQKNRQSGPKRLPRIPVFMPGDDADQIQPYSSVDRMSYGQNELEYILSALDFITQGITQATSLNEESKTDPQLIVPPVVNTPITRIFIMDDEPRPDNFLFDRPSASMPVPMPPGMSPVDNIEIPKDQHQSLTVVENFLPDNSFGGPILEKVMIFDENSNLFNNNKDNLFDFIDSRPERTPNYENSIQRNSEIDETLERSDEDNTKKILPPNEPLFAKSNSHIKDNSISYTAWPQMESVLNELFYPFALFSLMLLLIPAVVRILQKKEYKKIGQDLLVKIE